MVRGPARRVLVCIIVLVAGCKTAAGDDELGSSESSESGSSTASTSEAESVGSESVGSESTLGESASESSSGSSESSSGSSESSSGSSESSGSSGSSSESTQGSETSDTSGGEACIDGELQPPLPIELMGSTFAAPDDFDACGDPGGLDRSYAFVAPQTGVYVIDSAGSSFDTVLYVTAGACEPGPALICNDDAFEDSTSQVWLGLDAGELVTIHVDGLDDGSFGNFTLSLDLEPDPCPLPLELGATLPTSSAGMLEPGPGEVAGSCGGGGNELYLQWTAPVAGSYVFDTIGSSFDTVLHVRDASCFDELACDDDGVGSQSQVELELDAGQTIVLVLDAFGIEDGGSYELHIAQA